MNFARINIAITLMLAIMALESFSQSGIVKGFVYDAGNNSPVSYANVTLEGTSAGTFSNDEGYYILEGVEHGDYIISAFRIGYDTISVEFKITKDQVRIINLHLTERSYDLKEINVDAYNHYNRNKVNISEIKVLPVEISHTPSLGGMSDIAQHVRTFPGIIARGDIGGQVYIRGGTPIQNKVIIDETTIYSPFHSIGLYSVFDMEYVQEMDVYTGGYGAEFGGAISSVINVRTREGNQHRLSGSADLSTIGSRLLIEGPLVKDTTNEKASLSFIMSMRNSHFDLAKKSYYGFIEHELPFHFNDIYGKFTSRIGRNVKANFYGYNFSDKTDFSSIDQKFSRKTRGIGANLMIMPYTASVLVKIYAALSDYQINMKERNYEGRYSSIGSFCMGLKIFRNFRNQSIRFGLEIKDIRTDYHYQTSGFNEFRQEENSTEVNSFMAYKAVTGKFVFEPGIRLQYYATVSKLFPEPRISMRYNLNDHIGLKMSAGYYTQNLISAVSDKDIINYFEGYVSAPVSVDPGPGEDPSDYYIQEAIHLIVGIDYYPAHWLGFNIEGYWKDFPNLLSFNKTEMYISSGGVGDDSFGGDYFMTERGSSRGIDMNMKVSGRRSGLNVTYSLAWTEREYEDSDGMEIKYFPHFDRRHNFNISGNLSLGRTGTWEINTRWQYGSGFPYTPASGYYEEIHFDENANSNYLTQNGELKVLYGEYNSKRLPPYHRLDVGARKYFPLSQRTTLTAELTIINVYNQKNIYYIDRRTNEVAYQLPILPGLRVGVNF